MAKKMSMQKKVFLQNNHNHQIGLEIQAKQRKDNGQLQKSFDESELVINACSPQRVVLESIYNSDNRQSVDGIKKTKDQAIGMSNNNPISDPRDAYQDHPQSNIAKAFNINTDPNLLQLPPDKKDEIIQLSQRIHNQIGDGKLGRSQSNSILQPYNEYQVKDQVDFSALIMNEKKGKQLIKSASQKEKIELPKLKVVVEQSKKDLDRQKDIVSRIIQDKNYLLSMEYLYSDSAKHRKEEDLYKALKNHFLLQSSQHDPHSDTRASTFILHNSMSESNFKTNVPKKSEPLTKVSSHRNFKELSQLPTNDSQSGNMQLPNLKIRSLHRDKSPLQIPQAYQDFLDSHREYQSLDPSTNKNPFKDRSTSLAQLNLFRQKLSSSSGHKHFIVAYNLCETLKENKLELECNDYSKIKDLINGISKKRFEVRTNNLNVKGLPMESISKAEIDHLASQFQL